MSRIYEPEAPPAWMFADDPADELPNGVWESDGKYFAECCRCERTVELWFDPNEIKDQDNYQHYCGGSPGCCP